jgi:glucuronosyltransferase
MYLHCLSFQKNIKQLSWIFRDRPQSPLDTAIFWTEYVIRHGGASHLRSAALDLAWYQYMLLDVSLTLAVTFVLITFVLFLIIKKFCRCCSNTESISSANNYYKKLKGA